LSHGRYVIFQMAEVAIARQMFQEILRLIAELRPQVKITAWNDVTVTFYGREEKMGFGERRPRRPLPLLRLKILRLGCSRFFCAQASHEGSCFGPSRI